MAHIFFTAHLNALIDASPVDAGGRALGEALASVFGVYPRLKGYVLDERGAVRKHIAIFLDGEKLANDAALAAPIRDDSEIYVMQALSGGQHG
jgi:sulfur-carrier protein